jgi:hypothetical protein
MLKKGLVAALFFVSALSQAAFAQQGNGPGAGPGFAPVDFKEQKERVLQMLEERKSRLAQEKTCVEAAQDTEALQKCRPERPGGGMGPGSMRGGQQGQPTQPMNRGR